MTQSTDPTNPTPRRGIDRRPLCNHLRFTEAAKVPAIRWAALEAHRAVQGPVAGCPHLTRHRNRRWFVCACADGVLRCSACSASHQVRDHGDRPFVRARVCAACSDRAGPVIPVEVWSEVGGLRRVAIIGAGALCETCLATVGERKAS